MRFNYLVYPEAKEKLKNSGLLDRIAIIKNSENGLPCIGHTMDYEIVSAVNEMKENGYFNINNPPSPIQLNRIIRAYYPWPAAWTKWSDKIVKFYPGGLVQIEGKKPVKLETFLLGYPNFPIKSFV